MLHEAKIKYMLDVIYSSNSLLRKLILFTEAKCFRLLVTIFIYLIIYEYMNI